MSVESVLQARNSYTMSSERRKDRKICNTVIETMLSEHFQRVAGSGKICDNGNRNTIAGRRPGGKSFQVSTNPIGIPEEPSRSTQMPSAYHKQSGRQDHGLELKKLLNSRTRRFLQSWDMEIYLFPIALHASSFPNEVLP